MNEMYYPYYLFQGGGQRVPNRLGRSEQNILLNLNKNGNAVISGGFNVERGPLGIRRKISHGPIYVIPTQLAQSMVNANGNQSGNTTDSIVDTIVRSAESSPVTNAKALKEFTNFEDLWNRNYPSAFSAARRTLRPANGTSAAPDNSSQSAPSNANGVSQTAPSNESASNSNDYFSNMNEGQRQASYAGLSNEYNRRNAGQEKYEWASDVTVTPKSNKKGNRVNYSELSQYKVPYIGSQYIPPSNDFTPVQYTIPTIDGGYNNNYASVYQYGRQVDPRVVYNPSFNIYNDLKYNYQGEPIPNMNYSKALDVIDAIQNRKREEMSNPYKKYERTNTPPPFEFIPVVYRCGGSSKRR